MSNDKAKRFVSTLMSKLSPRVEREWSYDPELKKEARKALVLTEEAMLAISEPLFDDRLQEAGLAAEEFAPALGSIGGELLIDILSNLRMQKLAPVRPAFLYAAAVAYRAAGRTSEAHKRFFQARRLALARGQYQLAARVAIDLGVLAYHRNSTVRAAYWYERAEREAIQAKDLLVQAKALTNLAVLRLQSDPSLARELLEQSLTLKETAGASEESKAVSRGNLGILLAKMDNLERAYELFQKSLSAYQSVGDTSNLVLALLNLANSAAELGRFNEASRLYHKGLRIAKRTEDLSAQRLLHRSFAVSAFKVGRYKIASREFDALHSLLKKLGEDHSATLALHDLALSMVKAGDTVRARGVVNQALMHLDRVDDIDWRRRCLLLLAEIEGYASDSGLEILRTVTDLRGGRDFDLRLWAIRTLWDALVERGIYTEATGQLSREKRWLRRNPRLLQERLHQAGMILLDKGRRREALRLLRRALSLLSSDDLVARAWIQQDLGFVLAENERFDEACDLFTHNLDFARQQGDRALQAASAGNLGETERRAGRLHEAVSHLEEAVRLSQALHDTAEVAFWLNNLALALFDLGCPKKAKGVLEKALENAKVASAQPQVARVLGSMGALSAESGRFEEAQLHYNAAIETAKKVGLNDFALKMRFNRATAFYHQNRRQPAMRDAERIVQNACEHGLYELARETAGSAAVWAIEWQRPIRAGEFAAVDFLSNLMIEKAHLEYPLGLLALAKTGFSPKQYRRFRGALEQQLLGGDKSGEVWKRVAKLESQINRALTQRNQPKVRH